MMSSGATTTNCQKQCFVCRDTRKISPVVEDIREKFYFNGSNGSKSLNRQLWNVFIVRKLLDLSESVCEELLRVTSSERKKNPSFLWFLVCLPCSEVLEEGWRIYEGILRLEGELKKVGKRLRGQIKKSEDACERDREAAAKNVLDEEVAVEKRVWECLLDGKGNKPRSLFSTVDENPPSPDSVIKREVTSPRKEFGDDFDDNGTSLNSGDNSDSDWNTTTNLSRDESNDGRIHIPDEFELLIKNEVEESEMMGEHRSSRSSSRNSDVGDVSTDDSECDWKAKRSKRNVGRRKKLKVEIEDDPEDEDNVAPLRRTKSLSKNSLTAAGTSRSRESVRKAKSSLRSKKTVERSARPKPRLRSQSKATWKKCKNPNIKCKKCSVIFRQDSELKKHQEQHDKSDEIGNEFDCKTCGYPTLSETNLRQHQARKHKSNKYPCDVCGYEAPGKQRLAQHKRMHASMVDPKTYECEICHEQFDNYLSFTRHQRLQHAVELGITLYKCNKCPSVYTTNKMLQDHIMHVHEKNSRWCCEICGKGLLSEGNLKEHLQTHEPKERSEICYVCGVDFLNERTLREHVRKFHPEYSKHRKNKPTQDKTEKEYKCLYCDFTSPFRLVVMRHRKTHKEIFRHLCEICSNEYSTLSSLKLHKKIAHGDGKNIVQCDWCKKSFAHKHYLQNHMPRCKMRPTDVELPKNKKPFKDTLLVTPEGEEQEPSVRMTKLKKSISKKRKSKEGGSVSTAAAAQDLSIRFELEDGPKVMTCKYCNQFKTDNRGKMYGHVMQEHKEALEFKYSCELCGMKYTSKPSLTRHMVIVHPSDDSAVVTCIFCQKDFRHWSLLRVHYKHWCKMMPPGVPIPEPPQKRPSKEDKAKKPKELKFQEQRKRSAMTYRKRKSQKGNQGQTSQIYYPPEQDNSVSSDGGGNNLTTGQPSFMAQYPHHSSNAAATTTTGAVPGTSSSSVAALQMFSAYSGNAASGQRPWW